VEPVQGWTRSFSVILILPLLPPGWGLVLDKLYRHEQGIDESLGDVFHFSLSPTVTAGFSGFSFGIREVFKVALGV
jgi:hypothetical protein